MPPPPCHSRRTIDGIHDRFFCAHPRLHSRTGLVTKEMCMACPLWREPPPKTFRAYPLAPPRGRCRHLGQETGLRDCPSCRGSVRVKVFACRHPGHHETTLAECASCKDHKPLAETGTATA
jgi:hypothetical protein